MKYATLLFISIMVLCSQAASLVAATVSLESPANVLSVGARIPVAVIVEAGDVPVNSVSVSVSFHPDQVSFSGYQEAGAAIRMWVEPPKVSGNTVSFAGVIPGGIDKVYDQQAGTRKSLKLVTLFFTAKTPGPLSLTIADSVLYAHDGQGTALTATGKGITLQAVSGGEVASAYEVDTNPPELFMPLYIPGNRKGGTPPLLSFMTTDADSGVASYQVKIGNNEWQEAQSPYQLPRSVFGYRVTVRAVDYAGNAAVGTAEIPGAIHSWPIVVSLLLFLVLLSVLIRIIKR